jgi:hypothetical protein
MTVISPESRYFVVYSPDAESGVCVGKYDTNAPVIVPESLGDFEVVEVDNQSDLSNHEYDPNEGYQS